MKIRPFTWIFFFVVQTLYAEMYFYHPHSRLYLGGGYNPYTPTKGYLRCIEYDSIKSINSPAAISTRVDMSRIQSLSELHRKINFSSFLEGGYLFTKGQTSLEFDRSSIFSSNSLSWLIIFQSNYGLFTLKNPRLSSRYLKLSEGELLERCGSEIITEEKRSILLYAILTLHNLSSSKKEQLKTQFNMDISSFGLSASFQSKFNSFIDAATAMNHLSLNIFTLGGKGLTDMADLLDQTHHLDYKHILHKMHQYLKQLTRDYAVPTYFVSTSLHAFSHELKEKIPIFKRKTLTRLYHQYNQLAITRKKLKQLLTHERTYPKAIYQHLTNSLLFYDQTLNEVQQIASHCFDINQQAKCLAPMIKEPQIHWPQSEPSLTCEAKRKLALNKKLISKEFYHMAVRRHFVPIFSSHKPFIIDKWIPCDDSKN